MFTANSFIVKTWVKNITSGRYTMEQMPNISNLREVVSAVLNKEKKI